MVKFFDWGYGGRKIIRDSVYVFLSWIIATTIINIAYNNNVITDAVLGNWTITGILHMNHYLWLGFWIVFVLMPEMKRG